MNTRRMYFLIFLFFLAIGALFLSHLITFEEGEEPLNQGEIQTSAVLVDKTLYPLNFDQHQRLINTINQASVVSDQALSFREKRAFPFEQIIFFRFNKSPLKMTPISIRDEQLILETPNFSFGEQIQIQDATALLDFIASTHDSLTQ
ncbi:MAG: hypothetical protein WD595_01725 [Waddliaceae bacterium]